jgi:hypothetical protein
MGFPLYELLDETTRSQMNHLRTELKQKARARWEKERDRVLATKTAAKLARRLERAKTQGWTVLADRPKPNIKGGYFTREDLAIIAAELVAPREAQA